MSFASDIKESKNFRFVLGMVCMFLIMTYYNQKDTISRVNYSMSDDTKAFLNALVNEEKTPVQSVNNLYCDSNKTYPKTSKLKKYATDEGMKTTPWKEPKPSKPRLKSKTVDGYKPTVTTDNLSKEEIVTGEEQGEEEITEVEILEVINGPSVPTVGLIAPQEEININNQVIKIPTFNHPPAYVEDKLPPEDSNTGAINVVITRPINSL